MSLISLDPLLLNGLSMDPCIPIIQETYNFNHSRRGKCVIINNHHFDYARTQQKDRIGTDVDAEACESAFLRLGYEVQRYNDLKWIEMSMAMKDAAKEDHSDADSFVCVILSHGDDGVIYGTDGKLKVEKLFQPFKGDECPTLVGKPKLFFIQACRGARYDFGVDVDEDEVDAVTEDYDLRRIPVEADFLIAYSVVPGHFSWRNNVDGAWFIQALVRVLREYGDRLEVMALMTLVNGVVAFHFKSCTDDDFTSNMKQMPCMVSMLTKQLFFSPNSQQ